MSAPGLTPFHPKELGNQGEWSSHQWSGLLGVVMMVTVLWISLVVAIASIPFILIGVAELVADAPTYWRVRWIRRNGG